MVLLTHIRWPVCVKRGNMNLCSSHLSILVNEPLVQFESCSDPPADLRRLLVGAQGVVRGQLSRQLLTHTAQNGT